MLSGMLQTYLRNERPGGGVLDPEFVAGRASCSRGPRPTARTHGWPRSWPT